MAKKEHIVRYDPRKHKDRTDWTRIGHQTDEEIAAAVASDPDAAPIMPIEWWRDARWVIPVKKVPLSVRLDRDVLEWFKGQGPRYQSRINAVLRAYMKANAPQTGPKKANPSKAHANRSRSKRVRGSK